MAMVQQLISSDKADWRTPPEVLAPVKLALGGTIHTDPCASSDQSHWFALWNITADDDGLSQDWKGPTFMNPPYGRGMMRWIRAAVCQAAMGHSHVIGLLPANTGTKWGQLTLNTAKAVCFWRGRVTFLGGKGDPAPFNSMLPLWTNERADVMQFADVFGRFGKLVVL